MQLLIALWLFIKHVDMLYLGVNYKPWPSEQVEDAALIEHWPQSDCEQEEELSVYISAVTGSLCCLYKWLRYQLF